MTVKRAFVVGLALLTLASAQPAPGATGMRSPVFDVAAAITALLAMETTTDHPLDAAQAETVVGALRELRGAEAVTAELAEEVLQTIEGVLTTAQLTWIDMRLLAASPGTPGGNGAGAPVMRSGQGERGMGTPTTPGGQVGRQTVVERSSNPFAQSPFGDTLLELIELLAPKAAGREP